MKSVKRREFINGALFAKDLQTLATSDIVRRLCPAPLPEVMAKCTEFVKRGRCIWHWLAAGVPVYAKQKEWYDKTKELGFEYYLIDDGCQRARRLAPSDSRKRGFEITSFTKGKMTQ